MYPVNFDQSNRPLYPPPGVSEEECGILHVYADGESCTSCWALTEVEMALVNKTGRVYVTVWFGKSQPPIMIQVANPLLQPME